MTPRGEGQPVLWPLTSICTTASAVKCPGFRRRNEYAASQEQKKFVQYYPFYVSDEGALTPDAAEDERRAGVCGASATD